MDAHCGSNRHYRQGASNIACSRAHALAFSHPHSRDFVRGLAREKDATKKASLIEARKKELLAKTSKQKVEEADKAWAEFKSFYTAYCTSPKDTNVCSNSVLKTTYTADKRPKPPASPKPAVAAAPGRA